MTKYPGGEFNLTSTSTLNTPFLLSSQCRFDTLPPNMEFQEAQRILQQSVHEITNTFQKVPGSAMLIRYIQSSYQHDPVRSAIELILVIFFVRYLLASSYATHSGNFVTLTESVCLLRGIRCEQLLTQK